MLVFGVFLTQSRGAQVLAMPFAALAWAFVARHTLKDLRSTRLIWPLIDEPMVVALPSGHPLPARKRGPPLTLKSLMREKFIGYPRAAGAGLVRKDAGRRMAG